MFDKQQANSIFWSPQGQFLVLAGLRRSVKSVCLCVCICVSDRYKKPLMTNKNNFSDTSYES